jgi:hypothetical protein
MDWLRSEDLKEEKNVTAPATIITVSEPSALRHRQVSSPSGTRRTMEHEQNKSGMPQLGHS